MRNLINFIVKNIHWLLFLFLAFISVYMIIANEKYQRSKYLNIEREIVGRVYSVSSIVTSYIGLRSSNEELLERVAELQSKNEYLENYIRSITDSSRFRAIFEDSPALSYQFISARVVNNSISGLENLITLNKGSKDGVERDMGVFSPLGVVGIVMSTSHSFSVVIPILNSKSNLSCKVGHSNYPGSLKWDGKDSRYAYLEELARHVVYEIGDTIVTTGYSTVFPEGIRVGTVVDSKKQRDDNLISLKVKLFTNFNTIKEVLIVRNTTQDEQRALEEDARQRILKGGK